MWQIIWVHAYHYHQCLISLISLDTLVSYADQLMTLLMKLCRRDCSRASVVIISGCSDSVTMITWVLFLSKLSCPKKRGFHWVVNDEAKSFVPINIELTTVWGTQIIPSSMNYHTAAEGCNLLLCCQVTYLQKMRCGWGSQVSQGWIGSSADWSTSVEICFPEKCRLPGCASSWGSTPFFS